MSWKNLHSWLSKDTPLSYQERSFVRSLSPGAAPIYRLMSERTIIQWKNQLWPRYEHTRLIRFLASKETEGVGGKLMSTFIILQKAKYITYTMKEQHLLQLNIWPAYFCTFWRYQLDSQPQMEEHRRGTHNKGYPDSSYQLHSHELYFQPFLVLNNPMFHTWYVFCF